MIYRDIIAAVATAPGRGGIGIIRISGKNLPEFAAGLIAHPLEARRARLTPFLDAGGAPIDEGIVLFFPAPHSYTGEDVLELHGHGGSAVLQLLLQRCVNLGARQARPGEFTERAYLNGRMDLAQAEGVADLIEASSKHAARAALRSLQGDFSVLIQTLIKKLIRLRTLLEATLDFPEEEIDAPTRARIAEQLSSIQQQTQTVLEATRQGILLRDGLHVVLVGAPNVGKSSLLNRLAGEDIAIVTNVPGTTRDALREQVDLDGLTVHFIDTAGLRDSDDAVERIGMRRTWEMVAKADLALVIEDASGSIKGGESALEKLPESLKQIRVMNKADLIAKNPAREVSARGQRIWLSAKTGDGLDLLKQSIREHAGWRPAGEGLFTARGRHVEALLVAQRYLGAASGEIGRIELCAEELRLAQEALGRITGEFTADDLLGEIFSTFCIGK